jgi:hypothetical protein
MKTDAVIRKGICCGTYPTLGGKCQSKHTVDRLNPQLA